MPQHLFDGISKELSDQKLRQLVMQLHTDVIRLQRRVEQRPMELLGLLPHGADAFPTSLPIASVSGQIIEGILDGDLAQSTGDGATETTATLSVWSGEGASWADSGDNVTVTNRSDTHSAKSGEYLQVYETPDGEYRPLFFPSTLRLAKTDASHAKGASGTVSVYAGTAGSESDTGDNATAYNKFADLATTKWIVIARIDGDEYLIAGEC